MIIQPFELIQAVYVHTFRQFAKCGEVYVTVNVDKDSLVVFTFGQYDAV